MAANQKTDDKRELSPLQSAGIVATMGAIVVSAARSQSENNARPAEPGVSTNSLRLDNHSFGQERTPDQILADAQRKVLQHLGSQTSPLIPESRLPGGARQVGGIVVAKVEAPASAPAVELPQNPLATASMPKVTPAAVPPPSGPPAPAPSTTQAVTKATLPAPAPSGTDVVVKSGDTLWEIAAAHYGSGSKHTLIKNDPANRNKIGAGGALTPGVRLHLPPDITAEVEITRALSPQESRVLRILLEKHEGCRSKPYYDSKNILTCGIGWNLEVHCSPAEIEQLKLYGASPGQIEAWYKESISNTEKELNEKFGSEEWFKNLSGPRYVALLDIFHMGTAKLDDFAPTFAKMKSGEWDTVGARIRNWKWAADVKAERTNDIVNMIVSDRYPDFTLR